MKRNPRLIFLAAAACAAIVAASSHKPFSAYDAQVKPLLAQMTLDEKIGQMTQPEQEFLAGSGRRRDRISWVRC